MRTRSTPLGGGFRWLLLLCLAAAAGPVTQPASACTSFCFDTPDGPIFGANLDLRWGEGLVFVNTRGVEKAAYMLNSEGEPAQWVSRFGSVTFNLVGIEMPWSGMNEAGLVAGTMQLLGTEYPPADRRYPMSSSTLVQHLLDTCADIDEVITALDSVRLRGDAVHFLIADATGACVIVEYLKGKMILYEGENLPVRALANATYADCLRYVEHGIKPDYNPGRSAERVAAAAHWTGRYDPAEGIAPTDWALGVLTEAVVESKKWYKIVFGEPYTRWSIAYDVARREIRFRTVDHAPVRSLSFANLDFECGGPVRMLDVNAELEGPVEKAMRPFDAELNYEVASRFLERWGSQLEEEQVRELIDFLAGFECAD